MPKTTKKPKSHLDEIAAAAKVYGARSFDNYAQIRSVAETIRDGLCAWLDSEKQCVYLVPPQGPFDAQNYRSCGKTSSPISMKISMSICYTGLKAA